HVLTAGSVVTTYLYNRLRQPVSERLQVGTVDWTVQYAYSPGGHLAAITYPDSHAVAYAPNALGQATQAGTYATGATYYPNGALAAFTYGNGVVHQMTQNERGLPERSVDALGATAILDDSYFYDANGNVQAIDDAMTGS